MLRIFDAWTEDEEGDAVKRTRVWLAALIAVFALIVAACASNDDEGPTGGIGRDSGDGYDRRHG